MARKRGYITGFCGTGSHEGSTPVGKSGTPMRTCEFYEECSCKCHVEISQMFETAGMPRLLMPNPQYAKPVSPFLMPDPDDVERMRAEARGSSHQGPMFNTNEPLSVNALKFEETATGRRAKGQLEYEVLSICSSYLKGEYDDIEELTPVVIARLVDDRNPPSVGAVGAIFDRWEKLGFAVIERKPIRFISYTIEGMQVGLDNMKVAAKRREKLKLGEESRRVTTKPRR